MLNFIEAKLFETGTLLFPGSQAERDPASECRMNMFMSSRLFIPSLMRVPKKIISRIHFGLNTRSIDR